MEKGYSHEDLTPVDNQNKGNVSYSFDELTADQPVKERGFLGDAASHLARGTVNLLDTTAHAVDTLTPVGSKLAQGASDYLSTLPQKASILRPDESEAAGDEGMVKKGFNTALESAPQSLAIMPATIAGAKAGGAIGSLVGPAGTAIGATAGGLIGGGAAMLGLFGSGQYGQRKKEVTDRLKIERPDLGEEQINDIAHENAMTHAKAEVLGESAGDLAGYLIFSKLPGGNAMYKGGKAILQELANPGAIKAIGKGLLKDMPFEVGSEVGTSYFQNEADVKTGIADQTTKQAMIDSVIPAMFLSTGMGVAVGGYASYQRNQAYKSLNDGTPEQRAQAVNAITGTLAESTDENIATRWRDAAMSYVQAGKEIPLDPHVADLAAFRPDQPGEPSETAKPDQQAEAKGPMTRAVASLSAMATAPVNNLAYGDLVGPMNDRQMADEWTMQEGRTRSYLQTKNRQPGRETTLPPGPGQEPMTPAQQQRAADIAKFNESYNAQGTVPPSEGNITAEDAAKFEQKVQRERMLQRKRDMTKQFVEREVEASKDLQDLTIPQEVKTAATKQAREIASSDPVYSHMEEAKKRGGLNLKEFGQDYDAATISMINRRYPGIFSQKGTVRPDEFAGEMGYQNLDEMVQRFAEARTKKEIVGQIIKEKHAEWKDAERGQQEYFANMADRKSFPATVGVKDGYVAPPPRTQYPASDEEISQSENLIRSFPDKFGEDYIDHWTYTADQQARLRKALSEARSVTNEQVVNNAEIPGQLQGQGERAGNTQGIGGVDGEQEAGGSVPGLPGRNTLQTEGGVDANQGETDQAVRVAANRGGELNQGTSDNAADQGRFAADSQGRRGTVADYQGTIEPYPGAINGQRELPSDTGAVEQSPVVGRTTGDLGQGNGSIQKELGGRTAASIEGGNTEANGNERTQQNAIPSDQTQITPKRPDYPDLAEQYKQTTPTLNAADKTKSDFPNDIINQSPVSEKVSGDGQPVQSSPVSSDKNDDQENIYKQKSKDLSEVSMPQLEYYDGAYEVMDKIEKRLNQLHVIVDKYENGDVEFLSYDKSPLGEDSDWLDYGESVNPESFGEIIQGKWSLKDETEKLIEDYNKILQAHKAATEFNWFDHGVFVQNAENGAVDNDELNRYHAIAMDIANGRKAELNLSQYTWEIMGDRSSPSFSYNETTPTLKTADKTKAPTTDAGRTAEGAREADADIGANQSTSTKGAPNGEVQRKAEEVKEGGGADSSPPVQRTYVQSSKVESPAQGVMYGAQERKKAAYKEVKRIREKLKNEPIGGNRQGLRLDLIKAQENHNRAIRAEEEARNAIEKRANELGQTTFKKSVSVAPSNRADIPSELTKHLGKYRYAQLLRKGLVNIVETQEEAKRIIGEARAKLSAAWHGSPHDFEKFRTSAIGTGEGAQAYGYGLYFASSKDVAEFYQKQLAPPSEFKNFSIGSVELVRNGSYVDYSPKDSSLLSEARARVAELVLMDERTILNVYDNGGVTEAKKFVVDIIDREILDMEEEYPEIVPSLKILRKSAERNFRADVIQDKGRLYQVELAPQEDQYLLWDKPLSEQSEFVQKALGDGGAYKYRWDTPNHKLLGEDFYRRISDGLTKKTDESGMNGWTSIAPIENDKAASEYLHSIGIRGIKYLDGSSRSKGEGAHNYVIFSENDVEIKAKYSKDGAIQGFYLNGKVHLVKDGIERNQSWPVLLHEFGEHLSQLGFTNNAQYRTILQSIEARKDEQSPTGEAIRAAMARAEKADTLPEHMQSETLAYLIENDANQKLGIVRRIIAYVKKMLFKAGIIGAEKFTKADFVATAASAVRSASGVGSVKNAMFSMRDKFKPVDVNSESFKKWFKGSKVVDDDGNPLVVYRGDSLKAETINHNKILSSEQRKEYDNASKEIWGQYYKESEPIFKRTPPGGNMSLQDRSLLEPILQNRIAKENELNEKYGQGRKIEIREKSFELENGYFDNERSGDVGIHFTPSQDVATKFTKTTGVIHPVYLSIKKLYRTSDIFSRYQGLVLALDEIIGTGVVEKKEVRSLYPLARRMDKKSFNDQRDWGKQEGVISFWSQLNALLSQKKDAGIVYNNEVEGGGDSYVAFSPTQIKSAISNTGDFSATDPRILYSKASQTDTKAFKNWFGASKIKTNGQPAILYHGTMHPKFLKDKSYPWVFDMGRDRNKVSSDFAGLGIFLGTQDAANSYMPFGEKAHPFYVRMEKPFVTTAAELEAKLKGSSADVVRKRLQDLGGYDGIIIKDRGHAVVFDPNQVKSAQDNTGEFSRSNNDVRYSKKDLSSEQFDERRRILGEEHARIVDRIANEGLKAASEEQYFKTMLGEGEGTVRTEDAGLKTKARDWFTSLPKATARKALGALTLRQLRDVFAARIPQMGNFYQATREIAADANKIMTKADEVYNQWMKLDKANAKTMSELMIKATVSGVNPDAEKYEPRANLKVLQDNIDRNLQSIIDLGNEMRTASEKDKADLEEKQHRLREKIKKHSARMENEVQRYKTYKELSPVYQRMSEDAQGVYQAVKKMYTDNLELLFSALKDRIDRQVKDPKANKATMDAIRIKYDSYISEGPYFPLSRFGDYIAIAEESGSGRREVRTFDSMAERTRYTRERRRAGWNVQEKTAREFNRETAGASSHFVEQLFDIIENKTGLSAEEKNPLKDEINQLFIKSMPDLSHRKHFAHRQKVEGYSRDQMRAFADNMQHAAHHIARIRHADKMEIAVKSILDESKMLKDDDNGDDFTDLYNELNARIKIMNNPDIPPVTSALTAFGFVMNIGPSIASAMVNMSQTPLVAYPMLATRFKHTGAITAFKEFTRASADYFTSKPRAATGPSLLDNPKIKQSEKDMLKALIDDGTIDVTQAHSLAQAAGSDFLNLARTKYGHVGLRAMRLISYPFHIAELANRKVTALAAYRLAIKNGMSHAEAVAEAREIVLESHFDYSAQNRARWMEGKVNRVLLLFKQYSQQMTWLLGRSFWQAAKGETPEVKTMARKRLAMILGGHFALAGMNGLPVLGGVIGTLEFIAAALGDDDEPKDFETAIKNFMADNFGKNAAEAAWSGPWRSIPGLGELDMSSRVSLGDLWFRAPEKEAEGKDKFNQYVNLILGPVATNASNVFMGLNSMAEGETWRGIEMMLPKAIKDGMKAVRYSREGVKNWNGDTLREDLSAMELIGQSIGFSSSSTAEMYSGANAIKNYEHNINRRRQILMNRYVQSVRNGDSDAAEKAMDNITAFNSKNPEFGITRQQLVQSYKQRQRVSAQTKDGAYLPATKEAIRSLGRFANV